MDEIRSILLHLDASAGATKRLRAAHFLAATHGAELEVLYAVMPALLQYPMAAATEGQLAGMLATLDVETRARARAAFERERLQVGLPNLPWNETNDNPLPAFKRRAFEADLLVLAQVDPDDQQAQVPADFAASVLLETGKPALMLPYIDTSPEFGQTVLIAWKDTAASARAVTAALPMLRLAQSVHVASWDESAEPGSASEPLSVERFLRRHGVTPKIHHGGRPTAEIGELLLSLGADLQADLLVMGCYGHSRAREWLLGGVTRTIFQSMTLPVLMSH